MGHRENAGRSDRGTEVFLSIEFSFTMSDADWNPHGTAFEVLRVVAGMTSLCTLSLEENREDKQVIPEMISSSSFQGYTVFSI